LSRSFKKSSGRRRATIVLEPLMTPLRKLALVLALLVAPEGCGASVTFAPSSLVDALPARVALFALPVSPGDRPHLAKASPIVLGWVMARSGARDEGIVGAACVEAARRGGTHIYLRADATDISAAYTSTGRGPWTVAVTRIRQVTYVVLRVSPDNWGSLPEALRPARLAPTSSSK
jgi:hypothetical protein